VNEDDLVITEGRAYHRGDVVLLRSNTVQSPEAFERFAAECTLMSKRTGVTFVALDPFINVVEPSELAHLAAGTPIDPTRLHSHRAGGFTHTHPQGEGNHMGGSSRHVYPDASQLVTG
jgi:hypothetical protein